MQPYKKYLEISKEVQEALRNDKPVVALESTIISHGMPYPMNVHTAQRVEKIIRDEGAIPATIAILQGKLKVGLNPEEIDLLGCAGLDAVKTSRRDIPFVVAKQLDGATTVASTMIIASLAEIKIFATGGIGGVHRGAAESFDISADLEELARTDVAVVCAGIKSILDIPLTLEYLETKGVPVVGYQTDELPAFYTRKSGSSVDYSVQTAGELAQILKTKWSLGLHGGVVVGNPIPESYAMDFDTINHAIESALQEAKRVGIRGKESTPFLLTKVKELTEGKSLDANIELVCNNAKLAASLAVAYAAL